MRVPGMRRACCSLAVPAFSPTTWVVVSVIWIQPGVNNSCHVDKYKTNLSLNASSQAHGLLEQGVALGVTTTWEDSCENDTAVRKKPARMRL